MEDVLGNQLILICLPKSPGKWNGHLVVYAHGYMPPQSPLALPLGELTLLNAAGQPVFVPAILTDQGFAFVTSSYSKNGYAVEQAGNDLNALVAHFKNQVPPGRLKDGKVFITGASEGGLIATMLFETEPEVYDGAVALCGVGGGAPFQIQYLGDFRVVFDYYFPGVLPPSAANVPPDAFLNWPALELAIATAIASNPLVTAQLLTITGAPLTGNAALDGITARSALFYSIWGTNDLIATAGGMPYDNQVTVYPEPALNAGVERVVGSPAAQLYIHNFYQTTRKLQLRPLVTLHHLLDPVAPYQHEVIYGTLVAGVGQSAFLTSLTAAAPYGHCNFTLEEVLEAFAMLVEQVTE